MIETERLILRNYTIEDFAALYEIMSDKETMQLNHNKMQLIR